MKRERSQRAIRPRPVMAYFLPVMNQLSSLANNIFACRLAASIILRLTMCRVRAQWRRIVIPNDAR